MNFCIPSRTTESNLDRLILHLNMLSTGSKIHFKIRLTSLEFFQRKTFQLWLDILFGQFQSKTFWLLISSFFFFFFSPTLKHHILKNEYESISILLKLNIENKYIFVVCPLLRHLQGKIWNTDSYQNQVNYRKPNILLKCNFHSRSSSAERNALVA